MAKQKQDDQLEHTYSSNVSIRDVAMKTSQRRWMIGRSCKRGLGISVLAERHDDDISMKYITCFGLVSLFNGISTFVGYLMPKPFS